MVALQENFLGYSPRKGTVIMIGWFYFLICFIPFAILVLYAATGAEGLDRFLYGITDENPTKINFIKTVSGFLNEDELLRTLRYCEIKCERSRFQEGLEEFSLQPSTEDYFGKIENIWERWDGIKPKVTLSDVVGPRITKIVHRTLFAVEGGSSFFLTCIGTILAIGVLFNFWLLVAVYSDCASLMAAWIAEQIFMLIFDLSLLLCTVIYSGSSLLIIVQTLRISFKVYCLVVVQVHHHSLYHEPELENIEVGNVSKSGSIDGILDAPRSTDRFKLHQTDGYRIDSNRIAS